ncbi:MAG: phosphotransferase family protein [Acidobacteria bacterium]|nr:phosphotransferase family protein [Acidobacteriota bacterium]
MGETKNVRKGEEIDIDSLRTYCKGQPNLLDGEIRVEQFPGGSSNLTYLIRLGRKEFVLRRPPFGNTVKSAHDMRREFDVLSKLSAVYEPAPRPLLYCEDQSVIGSEFYLMERRQGLIIRGKIPGTLELGVPPSGGNTAGEEPPEGGTQNALSQAELLETSQVFRFEVCKSFIQNLADLHSLDLKDAKLETLGKPVGYNKRQVEGWTKRYFAARIDEVPEIENAIAWLNENIPAESGASLIHNDYKFDNIMLDPSDLTKVTAVLDWEMVTVGDPLMDLGTTLGYWISRDAPDGLLNMPFNPRVLMENITRQELVDMYAESQGRAVPDMLFYYVFGTFKIAVIAQQIYARFAKGFTSDARFATYNKFVASLGIIAASAISRKSI